MSNPELLRLLARLEAAAHRTLAQRREHEDVGPFRAYFDGMREMIWLNYAVPLYELPKSEREIDQDLRALREVFQTRQRTIRFEFTAALWPELPAALLRNGLKLQAEQPLMLCTAEPFARKKWTDVTVREVVADDDDQVLGALLSVQNRGFAGTDGVTLSADPSQQQIERLRVELRSHATRAAVASIDGQPAGAAMLSLMDEIAELVGVATVPELRRRSAASAASALLIERHFAQHRGRDPIVWLSAGSAIAQSVYHRLGFSDAGIWANYIDEKWSGETQK